MTAKETEFKHQARSVPESPGLRKSWILSRKGEGLFQRWQEMIMAAPALGPQMPGAPPVTGTT